MAPAAARMLALLVAFGLLAAGCDSSDEPPAARSTTSTTAAMDEVVRLNHVQVVGTHNSYHRRLPQPLLGVLASFDAKLAASVDYEHRPLRAQLDAGVRSLELDVFADRDGGRFASRAAGPLAGLPKESGEVELSAPGFKVLHIPEIDFASTCLSLRSCLEEISTWSEDHPRHLPVMVFVEAKDTGAPDVANLGFAVPEPIGPGELDALDAEIRSVFDEAALLTPDDVRGPAATLREAVTSAGWPTLQASRGKVAFTLIDDGAKRASYIEGHESLRGRAMFTSSGPDAAESAVVSRPEPVRQAADIEALVKQGFLVRTRADADTVEARSGDVARRDAALTSAATWVSTDFPFADTAFGKGYAVAPRIRCNPMVAPAACQDDRLE